MTDRRFSVRCDRNASGHALRLFHPEVMRRERLFVSTRAFARIRSFSCGIESFAELGQRHVCGRLEHDFVHL